MLRKRNKITDQLLFYIKLDQIRFCFFVLGSAVDLFFILLMIIQFIKKNKDLCKSHYVMFTVMALVQFLRLPFLVASEVLAIYYREKYGVKYIYELDIKEAHGIYEHNLDLVYSIYEYYLILFIPVCQTIITYNRVTVLWNPIKHKVFWTKTKTFFAILTMLVLPLIGIIQLFFSEFVIWKNTWNNWTRNIGFFLCIISVILAVLGEYRNVQIASSYMTGERVVTEKKLLVAVIFANISGCILFLFKVFQQYYFQTAIKYS